MKHERTFLNVTICAVKLCKLETKYRCNATKRPCGCIIYQRYCAVLIYGMVFRIYITWRGLACVAYPYLGAMQRPDCRDRRGRINSHVFFYFLNFTY